jgi:glycosyltransferase involved in cell wall biosynthesis
MIGLMKISIVTACYNSEATIRDTLASVAAQDWEDIEHVIIDGGSTDGTLTILREFANDRMRVVSEPDKGIFDAMNKGLRLATGDAIGFLNSDDFFCRSDAVRLLAESLEESGADAVVANVALVDPDNLSKVRRYYSVEGYRPWMMRFGHMPPHPTLYIRRAMFDRIGEFDDSYRVSGDFDLIVRLVLGQKARLEKVPCTLVGFRDGGNSTRDLDAKVRMNREILRSLRHHGYRTSLAQLYARYAIKAFQYVARPRDYRVPAYIGAGASTR